MKVTRQLFVAAVILVAAVDAQGTNYLLRISKTGNGGGTVTSTPAGIPAAIKCGSGTACQAAYPFRTQVTLRAVADPGSAFVAWGRPCTSVGVTCTVTMTDAFNVEAEFVQVFPVKVTKSGLGQGTVTSDPAGISCGAACTKSFPAGSTVELKANPATGSTFAGWTGSCAGTARTCRLSLTSAKNTVAKFDPVR